MECTCETGLGNLGLPACFANTDVAKRIIILPYLKTDGTINGIDLASDTLDQTFLDSKFKAAVKADRWYITPEIKNIVNERAEEIREEFEDGTSLPVQDGARTLTGIIPNAGPEFKKELDKAGCNKIGYYIVDKSGNLIGNLSREGYLDPIKIQDKSLVANFMFATDTTVQKVEMSFIVDQLMDDANIKMILASSITGDLMGATSLIDAKLNGSATSISNAGFTANLVTPYGGAQNPIEAEGLLLADFVAYNVTQSAAEPLTSVTETSPGVYAFVYTSAVSSADVIRVSGIASGTLGVYEVQQFTVTTP